MKGEGEERQDAYRRVFRLPSALERISNFGRVRVCVGRGRRRAAAGKIWIANLDAIKSVSRGSCRPGSRRTYRQGVEFAIKAKHYITIANRGVEHRARRLLSAEISDRLKIATQPINRFRSVPQRKSKPRFVVSLIGNFVTLVCPLSIAVCLLKRSFYCDVCWKRLYFEASRTCARKRVVLLNKRFAVYR